jgi:hypothetical protein
MAAAAVPAAAGLAAASPLRPQLPRRARGAGPAPRAAAGMQGDPSGGAAGSSGSLGGEDDYGYIKEYEALKSELLDNTRKAGGAIGAYLILTVGGGPAIACMVGAAGSYVYFAWLCRDVDAVKATDTVPIWEANKVRRAIGASGRRGRGAVACLGGAPPRVFSPPTRSRCAGMKLEWGFGGLWGTSWAGGRRRGARRWQGPAQLLTPPPPPPPDREPHAAPRR